MSRRPRKRKRSNPTPITPSLSLSLPPVTAQTIRVATASESELVAIFDDLTKEVADQMELYEGSDPDELIAPPSGFFYNRPHIAAAYKEDRLLVITDPRLDTPTMRALFEARGANPVSLLSYMSWRPDKVPAFAIMDQRNAGEIDMLWVREDWRRFGYARALVDTLGVTCAWSIPEAVAFWEHVGFTATGDRRGNLMCMRRNEK